MKASLSNPPKGEKLKRRPNLIWQPATCSLRLLGDRHSAETEAGGFELRVEKPRPPSSRVTEKEAAAQIRFARRGVTARQGQSRLKFTLSASNEPNLGSEAESQSLLPCRVIKAEMNSSQIESLPVDQLSPSRLFFRSNTEGRIWRRDSRTGKAKE